MNEQLMEQEKTERTLHDRLFKEFFYRFLPEFMLIFFPDVADRLNFATLRFLDKELVINLPNQELRITDIVAEVETWDGKPETIIVHMEVEGRDKNILPQRMSEYYVLLRVLRKLPVLPLAFVLIPGVGGLIWQEYREEIFGREVLHFHYGQIGIRDLISETYLAENSPVAAALAVLMQPEQESMAWIKLHAMQKVVNSDLSSGDKLFLVEMMNTYAPSNALGDPREEIMQKLVDTEMSWGERIRAEVRSETEEQMHEMQAQLQQLRQALDAQKQTLLRLLQFRFTLNDQDLATLKPEIDRLQNLQTLTELINLLLDREFTLVAFITELTKRVAAQPAK